MEVNPGYKQTEVGLIPEDWDVQSLEHITDPKRPISYGIVQTGRHIENGISCVRVIDLENGRINKDDLIKTSKEISASYKRTVLSRGDLVIALRGKIGELGVIKDDLVGANLTRGVALIALLPGHDNHYLYYYLSSPASKKIFERNLNGSALQEIPIGTLRNISAVLPPLPEQRAIAAALSDVDALIAALDRLIAKKRDIKHAAMQELLTGKRRLPGFAGGNGYKQTEVGEIPKDWEVRTLGSLGFRGRPAIKAGPFGSSLTKDTYVKEGYKVYGQEQVIRGDYTYGDYFISMARFNELKSCAVEPGDILLSLVGTTGRVLVIPPGAPQGIINPRLIRFSFDQNVISPSYFRFLFESENYQALLARSAQGGTMGVLNAGLLRPISIQLPSPAEQTAIAAVLSDMDDEIAALEIRRNKTRALKQGMMQELLTGRIRLT